MNSLLKQLKKISSYVQGSKSSFIRHNNELKSVNRIAIEKKAAAEYFESNIINSPAFRVIDLIKKHPNILTAVDIGSGAGWGSAALSKLVSEVIAIEPSQSGIEISKQLYPDSKYPNITWKRGMAEKTLLQLVLGNPTLFMTSCVLSHLRDKEVRQICQAVVKVAPAGSVLAFSECWSEDTPWHQHMWHIRTKAWWQAQFPDWTLEFGGIKHDQGDYYMGIRGVKN